MISSKPNKTRISVLAEQNYFGSEANYSILKQYFETAGYYVALLASLIPSPPIKNIY